MTIPSSQVEIDNSPAVSSLFRLDYFFIFSYNRFAKPRHFMTGDEGEVRFQDSVDFQSAEDYTCLTWEVKSPKVWIWEERSGISELLEPIN